MSHLDPQHLVKQLRDAGLRVTGPRRAILEVLAEFHDDHLTVEQLGTEAGRVAGRLIDLSTVYRTIDVLERAGSVYHVHLGHGPAVIHLREVYPHHHLVCEQCGRTVDIPFGEVEELLHEIQTRHGFLSDSVHFAMVGRCLAHKA